MGIFDQVKQAMQMRSEAKRIQQEIDKSDGDPVLMLYHIK